MISMLQNQINPYYAKPLCFCLKYISLYLAYTYCNYETIEEEVYPTGWDYDKLHNAMQWMSDEMITKYTPEIVEGR